MNRNAVLDVFQGCEILLETADYYLLAKAVSIPWIIMVPKGEVSTQTELDCFSELIRIKNKLAPNFPGYVYNLAKIGNKNPNFHIHLIFRNHKDPLWPEAVWCKEDTLEFDSSVVLGLKKIFEND
jgi:diadenosine tetraphosphate (Ap4A) HIT family hydrolase